MTCVLGLDIGTTSIKAVLFDVNKGQIISSARRPTPSNHPQPTFTEHDPESLWLCVAECIKEASKGYSVAGVSISSFAEAGLPLDKDGKPLYPIIAWHDPRSKPQADELLNKRSEEQIYQITGQKPGFSFGLMKILWLFENFPNIRTKIKNWVSVPDYILFRMTGEKFTDFTQASRTLLFDQSKKTWSHPMLQIANLDTSMLPEVVPSGTVIGTTLKSISDVTGLPAGIPCSVGGHDHLCGAFASGGVKPGVFIDSMGTSQAVMAITDKYEMTEGITDQGYVNYVHINPSLYLVKGGLKAGGKAVEYFNEIFRDIEERSAIKLDLSAIRNKPLWLPFFQGSGTPDRQPTNRAVLFGLNIDHNKEDIYRALMEGFAFWLKANIDALVKITGNTPGKMIAIGGTNQNALLQKIKASVLNMPLIIPSIPEASAVGAALLAAYGCGIVKSYNEAVKSVKYQRKVIEPDSEMVPIFLSRYRNGYIPLRKSLSTLQNDLYRN